MAGSSSSSTGASGCSVSSIGSATGSRGLFLAPGGRPLPRFGGGSTASGISSFAGINSIGIFI